jgi:hypothetical protein
MLRRNFKSQPIIYRQNSFVGGIFVDVPPAKEDEGKRRSRRAVANVHLWTSAYVSIRQHTSAYVSIRQHTSACVGKRGRGQAQEQA